MGSLIKWFCKRIGKKKLSKSDLEGLTFKVVKAFHESSISLQFQMEVCHWLLTNQVDLVNPEGHRLVPDVNKPLPLGGPLAYGITHWWFKRKELHIARHSAPSDRRALRSHMRILSVISIKTLERYSYAFLREIVLCRDDYNEYKISEADFKNLHPNDFEDLDRNDQKKMPRENEVHKFSDGTLPIVLHKLDHMVKDFRLYQYNLSMEHIIYSEDDKRRSEEFMEVIERRLKIQRIFQSLESFVGGRVRDVDYRTLNRTE
nr:hypothetical protein [Tanacetum cinerariifolium]